MTFSRAMVLGPRTNVPRMITPCSEHASSSSPSPLGSWSGAPQVSPVTDFEGVADEAVGYEVTLDVSAGGQSVPLYIDFITARVGRAFVGFNFSNFGAPIPAGLAIVQSVVDRLAQAQGST